jgi:hypothetical protein
LSSDKAPKSKYYKEDKISVDVINVGIFKTSPGELIDL